MRPIKNAATCFVLLCLYLQLTSCTLAFPGRAATPTAALSASPEREPPPTRPKTEEPTINPSVTHTATPTATITITPTPTFISDFSGAQIAGYSYQNDYQTFVIAVRASGAIKGAYHVLIEGFTYTCEVLPMYPNSLYCSGPPVPVEKRLTLQVIEAASGRLVFEDEFAVPLSQIIPPRD